MNKSKVLVIVGTVRQGRTGIKVANWYINEARKANLNMDLELYDVASLNLPLFNEAFPPAMHQYTAIQNTIAAKIAEADGFVFITGEYNHTIPGSLVNFLDYIGVEWAHKCAAYVGYGSLGGVRAIEHLIQVMAELGVASVAKGSVNVQVRTPWFAMDESGVPKAEFVSGDIAEQLKELLWWTDALKAARGREKP